MTSPFERYHWYNGQEEECTEKLFFIPSDYATMGWHKYLRHRESVLAYFVQYLRCFPDNHVVLWLRHCGNVGRGGEYQGY